MQFLFLTFNLHTYIITFLLSFNIKIAISIQDIIQKQVNNIPIIAIEVKTSTTPSVTRGFWIVLEDIKATESYVIEPVKMPYLQKIQQ